MGKRYYDERGRSAPAWFMRPMMILAFPIILLWAMVYEILRGFANALYEIPLHWDEFKRYWKSAR